MSGHRKDAFTKGGHGRHLQNRMSRTSKRAIDRRVDKRRRQEEQSLAHAWVTGTTEGD